MHNLWIGAIRHLGGRRNVSGPPLLYARPETAHPTADPPGPRLTRAGLGDRNRGRSGRPAEVDTVRLDPDGHDPGRNDGQGSVPDVHPRTAARPGPGRTLPIAGHPGGGGPHQRPRARPHAGTADRWGSSPPNPSESADPRLSFNLVGPLPLDLDFKQTLLGMKSEAERMQAVISYFEAILPNLRRTVRVRQKAGGNGHVH